MKGLGVIRESGETWRETVSRIGKSFRKQNRCLAVFDRLVHTGEDEDFAALNALSENDCLTTIDVRELIHAAR